MATTTNTELNQVKTDLKAGTGNGTANQTAPISTYSEIAGGTPTATYIDSNGNKKTGVIAPISKYSGSNYFDSMRNFYDQMYNDQVAANNQALENARTRAQEATDAQLEALANGYQGTNRQLYRDYMNSQRTLPQQMAAHGYTGGLSESGRLRLQNSYQESLAENERSRMSDVSNINQALAQQLYEAQAKANAANQTAAQNRYGYLAALQEAQYKDQQNRAATMASTGDFSGYLALGYTQSQVDSLTRAWLAQNPGLLSTWVSSHPKDAARLGISVPTASYSGGGGRSRSGDNGNGSTNGDTSLADSAGNPFYFRNFNNFNANFYDTVRDSVYENKDDKTKSWGNGGR